MLTTHRKDKCSLYVPIGAGAAGDHPRSSHKPFDATVYDWASSIGYSSAMWWAKSEPSVPDNAIWDDGEWVSLDEIDEQLEYKEWRARYPNADLSMVEIFKSLLYNAQDYHELTGRHLQVYGDIGELFGVITHGLKLHRNYAQGSDGRIGNDFVEVKTITPFKTNDVVELNLKRNFNKVLIVKISADFEVRGKLIPRKSLPRVRGDKLVLAWDHFDDPKGSAVVA